MPDLCPKGIDLGVKPSAPLCPPALPPYLGFQAEQTKSQGTPPGRVASVSVEFQTVPIVVEMIYIYMPLRD